MTVLAPPAVRLAAHRYRAGDEAGLAIVEWASLAPFAPMVRDGMIAARHAARRLFRYAGLRDAVALPRRDGLAPRWPAGWHGSLAHCGPQGVATIARDGDVRGVGIDIERATLLDDATLAVFAREEERCWAGAAQDRRLHLFCAKEAAYKAFRCQSDAWRDPHDIAVAADLSHAVIADGPTVALTRLDLVADAVVMLAVLR